MIRNIIFDVGRVLIQYDPPIYTRRYIADETDAALTEREVFNAPEWIQADRGDLSDEDYLKLVLRRLPERLHEPARYLYGHWHEMAQPIAEMEPLARTLKENGYGLYLLTNMSLRFHRFYRDIPATRYFDGFVLSAEEHTLKPEQKIYRILLDRYGLKPEECFFIDDRAENIEAGKSLGIAGYQFRQDMDGLIAALRKNGVRV